MIDSNVWLGRWPFRRLPAEDAGALADRLRRGQVDQAWVGSLEGLFHRDITGVNARLAEECRNADPALLVPFGTVNPMLPDWEEDLRRCHEAHRFRGIRLAPSFHGYGLNDPRSERVLTLAGRRGLIVQVVVMMEDERTQHPCFRVPPVELGPLRDLVRSIAAPRLVVLNGFRKTTVEQAAAMAAGLEISFDIATLEGVDRVAELVERLGAEHVLFGSHYPLFHLESSVLKLRETALDRGILTRIRDENARRLLAP